MLGSLWNYFWVFDGDPILSAPTVTPIAGPYIEFELVGRGLGWTVCPDVLLESVTYNRGLPGGGIADSVADPGSLSFRLNNSSENVVHLQGRYTPDHANCLPGFEEGIGVRVRYTLDTGTIIRWTGTLEDINPVPGKYASRTVSCMAVGWMEIAATTRLSDLPVLVNKRGDEVFQTLISSLPPYSQPRSIEVDLSLDTYPYTLDRTRDEQTRLREELYRLAISGMDRVWEKGDGTIVYESRSRRVGTTADRDTFIYHHGFDVTRSRSNIINQATFTANPRIPGTLNSLLYSLNQPMAISPGSPQNILGPWTDPANPNIRVGAVDLTTLVPGVDYVANTAADGSGTDITNYLTVLVGLSGNATTFRVELGGAVSGFLTVLQQRGQPLLNYGQTGLIAEDASSISLVGLRPININMPYQGDLRLTQEAAQYVVFTRKDKRPFITSFHRKVSLGNQTALARSLSRDISDRIRIVDAISGVASSFHINTITEQAYESHIETVWNLSPADSSGYWFLEDPEKGILDSTTVLGFGYILGHTDIAHIDTHLDTPHFDVAHVDTHTDHAHQDVAHTDSATHGDIAHTDVAHADNAHNDITHLDTHLDDPFEDHPHQDSHSDNAHQDAHADSHTDIAHQDFHADFSDTNPTGHDDEYTAIPHSDIAHADSHNDAVHNDSHNDFAFDDEPHEDAHSDVIHTDVSHGDTSHLDVAHSDAAHADTAHIDTVHDDVAHADTLHTDISHTDEHSDTLHGDVN